MLKKLASIVFVIVFVVVFAVMILGNSVEHIEDLNGADNYALQTISEQAVIDMSMGSRGGISESKKGIDLGVVSINDGIKYSSKKFTGLYEVYNAYVFKGSDIVFDLMNFEIHSGNLQIYVVFEDRIIGTIKPDAMACFEYNDIEQSGNVRCVIAGESASFEFITNDFNTEI